MTLTAFAVELECRIEASSADQLAAIERAVARHLDRFAVREAPLAFAWKDVGAEDAAAAPAAPQRQPVG